MRQIPRKILRPLELSRRHLDREQVEVAARHVLNIGGNVLPGIGAYVISRRVPPGAVLQPRFDCARVVPQRAASAYQNMAFE